MSTETTWHIVPENLPFVIRYCSKCNKKMDFYCSEKFRVNSNQLRADIWLIYKCTKCDTTWKLTIMKGVRPSDLPAELFEKFTNNDADLAIKYAFDKRLLKQSGCEINYSNITYHIEGLDSLTFPLSVRIKSQCSFDQKLSKLLAELLGMSVGGIRKLVDGGLITTNPECNIMKYRIRADFELFINKIETL